MSRHPRRRLFEPLCAACVLSCVSLALAGERYQGEAYAAGSGKLLYREVHSPSAGGDNSSGTVTYLCGDGKPFARKRLVDRPDAIAPDFEMTDGRSGYVEGVRSENGKRIAYVRAAKDAIERSAALKSEDDLVIDAGFDAFVRAHWDDLVAGKSTTMSFLVPSRLEAMGFDIEHVGNEAIDGKPAEHFRLELARWYGGLLPSIDVFYDRATKRLRRYEGVSNVRDADRRNVSVRIEFPPAERGGAVKPADATAALDGTCKLS